MKKILFAMSFLFVGLTAFGQKLSDDFEVSVGDPYQVVDAADKRYFSLGDGKSISVKTRGAIVTIQRYDGETGEETNRNVYEDFPKYNKVQDIVQVSGKLFYIYEAYNKKAKTFSVYCREINTDDASFKEDVKLFTTEGVVVNSPRAGTPTQGPLSGSFVKFGKKFRVYTSFDGSKILINYRNKPLIKDDSKNYDKLGFYVFDNNMNELWGEEVKMPHTEKEMNNLAYTVGKDGTAFMMAYLREAKKFELISIKEGSLENTELDIKGDMVFEKFELEESKDGKILCAGYYASGYDVKVNWTGGAALSFNTQGIYYFSMTPAGEVSDAQKIPFSMDLIQQYLTDKQAAKLKKRQAEKGHAGIEDLKMVDLIAQEDGSVIVVGEQQYVRNEMYGTSTQTVYHYSNIVLTKIGPDGEELWSKKLPKNQAGVPTGFQITPFFEGQMSIKYVKGKNGHYVLFVDNPKNENLAMNKVPAAHKNGAGGFLTAFKVSDEDGSVDRHTIAKLADINGVRAYQFKVTRIFELLPNNFLMEIYIKGKKDAMVKMTLDK